MQDVPEKREAEIMFRGQPYRILSNELTESPHSDRKKPNIKFRVLIVEIC